MVFIGGDAGGWKEGVLKLSTPTVSIFPCQSYEQATVDRAVRKVLEGSGGWKRIIAGGARVLIKPNMLAPEPAERVVTTHPAVIKAVVRAVQEAGGIAFVGDSPMEGPLERVAEVSGIMDVIRETGATLLEMEENVDVEAPGARTCRFIKLSDAAMEMDAVINVAKLKTHTLTGMTAAVKNCYGLIGGRQKKFYHLRYPLVHDFADFLLDLYLVTRPALSIVDAVVAMEGLGPRHGRPEPVGAILASEDAVALDAVSARLVGFDLAEVSTLDAAIKRKLIGDNLADIEIVGPFRKLIHSDFDRGAAGRGWTFLLRYTPAWIKNIRERKRPWPCINEKCTGCGRCLEYCPVEAMFIRGEGNGEGKKRVSIKYDNCLRCYCCLEICPTGAVSLKRKRRSSF